MKRVMNKYEILSLDYSMNKAKILILSLFSLFNVQQLCAQTSIEFINSASGPTTFGPTTTNQVITFYTSAGAPSSPTITATFSLSNQQFSSTEGNPTVQGTTFGSNTNVANTPTSSNIPLSNATYDLMNAISTPANSNFTACKACVAGTGIDITQNRAVALYNSSDALINTLGSSSYALNSRVRYADLTITFNQPVNNPILHVVGLGGFAFYNTEIPLGSGNFTYYDLGFTTELDLLTSGVTLSKLSGNTALTVTTNSIQNTAAQYGSATGSAILNGVTRTAASGSISVNGTGITSLSFRIYLKGDGGTIRNAAGNVTAANNGNVIQWSNQLNHQPGGTSTILNAFNGDKYLLGMSLQPCQQIITASPSSQTVCQGVTGANIAVQTDMNTANSIRFVKFATDRMAGTTPTATEAAAIYAGTAISTVTPTGASSLYTATYVWNSADFPTAGTYYVYAILNPNPGGDCYALQEFIVTITAPLAITTQPNSISECIGGTQSFSVVVTGGTTPLSYQWQSSSTLSGVYTNIVGATSATYLLPSAATSTLFYRVIVTSASGTVCNTITSTGAAGTVVNDPSVTVVTLPTTVCTSGSIALTAIPTIESGSCTVQWQSSLDGTTWINAGTGTTYNTANLNTLTRYRAQLVACTSSGCCN